MRVIIMMTYVYINIYTDLSLDVNDDIDNVYIPI